MSDRQSKKHEEATKTFFSCVSERTRSKRAVYLGITAQTQGIPSSSYNDSIRERKRKRQTKPKKSGNNNVDMDMNLPEIEWIDDQIRSASKIRGSTHAASSWKNVGSPSNKPSASVEKSAEDFNHLPVQEESGSEYMTPEDLEIQRVDEAELPNRKTHFTSKRGQSEMLGLCESPHHSVNCSLRDYSTASETLADDSTSLSNKAKDNEDWSFRDVTSKGNGEGVLDKGKAPLYRQGYSAIRSKKKRANIVKISSKVSRDEDMDDEELEIEMIDESEFRKRRRRFASKIGSSSSEEQDEEHIAGTSARNVRKMSKKKPSSIKNDRNKQRGKASVSALKKKGPAWNKRVEQEIGSEERRQKPSFSWMNPRFDHILKEYHYEKFHLPSNFVKESGLTGKMKVWLKYPGGKSVRVQLNSTKGRVDIGAGWALFWRTNNIIYNKNYSFEFIPTNVIWVQPIDS
ncbi:uncharacterized protein LOC131022118 [Salvia miltiorrhiza]|uniref:uncharacterized protein LOC131022118 n=1 Tax=Salvia miltiorrhiza TaxID=226208 RepID=UPI0025ACC9FA|nr:uncharacterized protein LOC131022118 [Salvia miltiorrhiza]